MRQNNWIINSNQDKAQARCVFVNHFSPVFQDALRKTVILFQAN